MKYYVTFSCGHISIHAAREGGDRRNGKASRVGKISIHAAREGGDVQQPDCKLAGHEFQSTPPVKAATKQLHTRLRQLRFQSTPPVKAATKGILNLAYKLVISIHAAREGGDFGIGGLIVGRFGFQSTPPVKAATCRSQQRIWSCAYFNPRRP